jgi:hypothetical protein
LKKTYTNFYIIQTYRTLVSQSSFLNNPEVKSVWNVYLTVRRNLEELKQIALVIEDSENKIKQKYATDEKSEVDGDVRKVKKEYESAYLNEMTEISLQTTEVELRPIKESDLEKFFSLNEGLITSVETNILFEMMEV